MGRPAGWMKELTGRAPMKSPGHPTRPRDVERLFWREIAKGLSSVDAALAVGVSPAAGVRWFRERGGMPTFMLDPISGRYLSFQEREEIAMLRTQGVGIREIARQLGRSPSTISRELRRNAATRGGKLKKTTHCTENCTWFTDTVVPSIHGQWASQTSTLSKETYSYDEAGRLVKTEETPAGKHCKTRLYSYDEDSNRLALARNESTTETCTTEGLSEEKHGYDTADRLLDSGIEYNAFGDITTLPAADAGGEKLTSRYYTDGQLAEQEQAGETIGYTLDPARRTLETISTGRASSTVANHYPGEGASPAWTSELGGKWTRYIQGYRGMDAIQTDGEEPTLQVSNLRGDIIGTASMSQTATKLLSSTDTTEYGVPTGGTPARYSWLGTKEIPTELPSGVTAMGARSYVPEIGRFLQPDPQPGGSANAYAYTYGDPLNQTDTTGQWTLNQTSGGLTAIGSGEGEKLAGGVGIAAGAILPPPVNAQIEAEFQANPPWDQATAGTEEYEEYWEEEWEEEGWYEEAAYRRSENGQKEAQVAAGVFYQPVIGRETIGSRRMAESAVPLCKARQEVPCAEPAGLRFRRSLCAGMAILAAACNDGDEHYRVNYEPPAIEREGWSREAEHAGERSGGEDIETEIVDGIVEEIVL